MILLWLAGIQPLLEIQPAEMRIFEAEGKKQAVIRFASSVRKDSHYEFTQPSGTLYFRDGEFHFSAKSGRYDPEKRILLLSDSVSGQAEFLGLSFTTEEMTMNLREKKASGVKGIQAKWGNMEVSGKVWELDGEARQIFLRQEVKGTIAEKA